jgi:hypothetical protein
VRQLTETTVARGEAAIGEESEALRASTFSRSAVFGTIDGMERGAGSDNGGGRGEVMGCDVVGGDEEVEVAGARDVVGNEAGAPDEESVVEARDNGGVSLEKSTEFRVVRRSVGRDAGDDRPDEEGVRARWGKDGVDIVRELFGDRILAGAGRVGTGAESAAEDEGGPILVGTEGE